MALGVAEVQGIDDHADVRRVFAGLADVGDLDQFEGGLVEALLEFVVSFEVAVGLLDYDVALEQKAFEDFLDVEAGVFRLACSQRDVFEVEEYRHCGVWFRHGPSFGAEPSFVKRKTRSNRPFRRRAGL